MVKFRMPAEWEPHEATWLTWPKDPVTFPGKVLAKVEETYIEMILGLTPGRKSTFSWMMKKRGGGSLRRSRKRAPARI
ncbi:MAG: agmatine deiminase family protein [Candidatus Micrarchaeia archaeon]